MDSERGVDAIRLLEDEARAMLTRLGLVKAFALHETMVPAAAVSVPAQSAIETYLARGRRELRLRIHDFLNWLRSPQGRSADPAEAHTRFAFLRLRFNAVLTHFDVFAIVMTQRSEAEMGVWLSGLDVVARDALSFVGRHFEVPPVVCYLDRGFGAAIRRARTRLPGGGETPVAIVRIPRERMIGSGIASSLVHEVGHQAAAILDLVAPLRLEFQSMSRDRGPLGEAAPYWARWISEIVADFWATALVGVGSTLGLTGVLSLPRAFVFRAGADDPHPVPWIRVMLSCAMGDALYPHPQWRRLADVWTSYYPPDRLPTEQRRTLALLENTIPVVIETITQHRPRRLHGRTLLDIMPIADRQPRQLRASYQQWRANPSGWRRAAPTLAFAVISQARSDGQLSPESEARLLAELLSYWALRTTIDTSEACAQPQAARRAFRPPVVQPLALGVA